MVSDTAQKKSIDPTAGLPVRRRVRCYTRGFGLVFAAALVLAGLSYVSALEHLRLRTAGELNQQARLAAAGQRVRVYVPYGVDWYGYFTRRLAERPANVAFFVRALFGR